MLNFSSFIQRHIQSTQYQSLFSSRRFLLYRKCIPYFHIVGLLQINKVHTINITIYNIKREEIMLVVFNKPGVAGAVL